MKGLRSFLETVRLIEPTADNAQENSTSSYTAATDTIIEQYVNQSTTKDSQLPNMPTNSDPAPAFEEGISFDEIYLKSGVAQSEYPIEKLIKLLDGLRSMPIEMQKSAVQAMDDSDDSWTLTDVMSDAKNKIDSLVAFKQLKQESLQEINASTGAQILALESQKTEKEKSVREQIAELEKMLETERETISQGIYSLRQQAENSSQAFEREKKRIDEQIKTFQKAMAQFQTQAPSAT